MSYNHAMARKEGDERPQFPTPINSAAAQDLLDGVFRQELSETHRILPTGP